MNTLNLLSALVVCALALLVFAAETTVKLADIFSDHLVLQRGQAVPVWGTAGPGEQGIE